MLATAAYDAATWTIDVEPLAHEEYYRIAVPIIEELSKSPGKLRKTNCNPCLELSSITASPREICAVIQKSGGSKSFDGEEHDTDGCSSSG
jgi:hypothetical protein